MKPAYILILLFLLPCLWIIYMTQTTTFYFDIEAAKIVNKTSLQLTFGERRWWYEWVVAGTIFFPLILSFDRRVAFYKQWRYILPAIFLTGAFFIIWDIYFTSLGVWGFNDRYIGVLLADLPLGEWLFFLVVPYACLFIYACLEVYFSDWGISRIEPYLTPLLVLLFAFIGFANLFKTYTAWTFLLSAALLFYHYKFIPNTYRARFYQAYLVGLIPFLLVNNILTGAFNQEPVVLYNDAHNLTAVLGLRLLTIPFDDLGYYFLLLLMNVGFWQWFKPKG